MTEHKDPYYSNRLLEVTRQFTGTNYQHLVEQASSAYIREEWKKLKGIFEKFPTEYTLLEALVQKLKGKSVYANMKKVLAGDKMTETNTKIALSSLLTHIYIEQQKFPESKVLENVIWKKLEALRENGIS